MSMLKPILHLARTASLIALLTACTTATSLAGNDSKTDFANNPKAIEMAESLYAEHGIAVQDTLNLLHQAQFQPSVVKAVLPPVNPTVKNWDVYRSRFVEPYRIKKGFEFWQKNADVLKMAEEKYGVPQSVIVAIIGIETIYGRHTGNYRVIDALSTLAFAYPEGQRDRSDFFKAELAKFLVLCKQSNLDATEVKGSYAGAIGLGQFMPSSWLNYAVDGNGDSKIDLFHTQSDAIFSVANFLKVHGWQPGAATLVPVTIRPHADLQTLLKPDIQPTFTGEQMNQLGLTLEQPVQPDEKLALVELVRGEKQPSYVVGGQNFYTVTRYNRSAFYATSVLELAQAIALHRRLELNRLKTPVKQ
ncbi:soluble lytic transglycosylase B [Limnobacter litoralis]|uniref:Soluble lytic transglycosylase B n=2 Tax=Burkholderiaceae TaxID=119060 RepID=A0ABQ5YVN1_9BURK|nr:soluble lytic transglycosylase B [Limnobacter litoralis]